MSDFTPYSGFDPMDGAEPHMRLSTSNPVGVDEMTEKHTKEPWSVGSVAKAEELGL